MTDSQEFRTCRINNIKKNGLPVLLRWDRAHDNKFRGNDIQGSVVNVFLFLAIRFSWTLFKLVSNLLLLLDLWENQWVSSYNGRGGVPRAGWQTCQATGWLPSAPLPARVLHWLWWMSFFGRWLMFVETPDLKRNRDNKADSMVR